MTAQPHEANGDEEQDSQAVGAVQREAWARGLVPPVEEVRPGDALNVDGLHIHAVTAEHDGRRSPLSMTSTP